MVNQKKKRFSDSALEPIARDATKKALEKALAEGHPWISPEQDKNLTLGYGPDFEGDVCGFELYIATDPPKNALIISRAFVDRYTAKLIGEVEVYLPPVPATELPEW
jgi:hypothetical protein